MNRSLYFSVSFSSSSQHRRVRFRQSGGGDRKLQRRGCSVGDTRQFWPLVGNDEGVSHSSKVIVIRDGALSKGSQADSILPFASTRPTFEKWQARGCTASFKKAWSCPDDRPSRIRRF